MLDIKMYPLALIWLESWSHTIKGMIEENYRKNSNDRYHLRWIAPLDWPKTAKHFSANSHRTFHSWHEMIRRAGKKSIGFLPSDRCFSLWVVISLMHIVHFILSKCLLDSYQLILIFTDVWFYKFCVSSL